MTAMCAWKRQVIRSGCQPEHIGVASLTSVELCYSVQQEASFMLENYAQCNLQVPSAVGLQSTLIPQNFMA